ncbi:short-chain dehydrogenase [Croceicoccus estronivorus]|uniref:SDR family oxidoreductase n=1 Tax=Croceicoccus estronivorus TaxID=1172626 RepID=UPI00082EC981|nr:SDR family oxidoreductase [Croceicoccus estronivorus]OCC23393.1 short-chain dehydrogenase [Croceicoccus estronivorus]
MTDYGRTDAQLASMAPSMRDGYFAGQTVIVTGAGSGLGRGIAYFAARLGANVVLCGRKPEPLAELEAALTPYGSGLLTHQLNIRDPEAVEGLFAAVGERFGAADIVINNAGGQFPSPAIDISPRGWNAVIDTNLTGTWHMMRQAAVAWRDVGRGGSIVNIIAVVGRGMPGVAHTAAARAGVVSLSKSVAIEWAPLGIRVNCVAPGLISTSGMNVYDQRAVRAMTRTNVMKRFGQIEEIADAVCFVGGSAGGFMTGEVVHVDGGNQIWGDQWTIDKPDYFKVDLEND